MVKKVSWIILGIFLIGVVSATYCCEKTLNGVWCKNGEKGECNEEFAMAPTSCDATSYCKLGTCIGDDGTCDRNTAQKTCVEENGLWKAGKPESISQCQSGCCLMGEVGAAFVPQARCKTLSTLYGIEVDFRANINTEMSCIASVTSDVKGACVTGDEISKTCRFVTQKECSSVKGDFHAGYLCTAEDSSGNSLSNCAPDLTKTTCYKEKVYFVDTCGNRANIYDYSRKDDPIYWTTIIEPENSCGYGEANKDSETCGNCDYFLGSTCKASKRGQDSTPKAGNNICRDLDCKYDRKTYKHGERWCAESSTNNDLPGSQHYVLGCRDNEVLVESCAVRRAEICVQDDVNGFKSAQCRANMWQDCVAQTSEQDCLNKDQRDCKWVKSFSFGVYDENSDGVCTPNYAPGFDFWTTDGEAQQICAQGTVTCEVVWEKGLFDNWDVKDGKNKECVEGEDGYKDWLNKMEGVCSSFGDCGSTSNYKKQKGYNTVNATRIKKK